MIKVLDEKQKATELFIKEQQEITVSEAEARLAELREHSRILQESQAHLMAVRNLPDTKLIKVGASVDISVIWLKLKKVNRCAWLRTFFVDFLFKCSNIYSLMQRYMHISALRL